MELALIYSQAVEVKRSVQLDMHWLGIICTVLIPLLTGLVTKKLASSRLKSIVTTALSILTGALNGVLQNNGSIPDLDRWVTDMVIAFVIATASYYGLWKPSGAAAAVQNIKPNTGIGKAVIETESVMVTPASAPDVESVVADLMQLTRDELVAKATEAQLMVAPRATKSQIARQLAEATVINVGTQDVS